MADVRFNVVDVASYQLESMQNVEDELLVQEVQKYHCVWNTSSRAYKENPKKQEAWRKIATALGQNEELLRRKWKNLRDGYVKCKKKIDALTRSGAGASRLPTCKLFDQLHFLRDTCSNRITHSNINPFSLEQSSQPDNNAYNIMAVENTTISMVTSAEQSPQSAISTVQSSLNAKSAEHGPMNANSAEQGSMNCTSTVQSSLTATSTEQIPLNATSIEQSPLNASSTVHSPVNNSLRTSSTVSRKRKSSAPVRDAVDLMLAEALTSEKNSRKELGRENDDADFLFCKSLVPALKCLPAKQSRKLKIEIQKLFLKYECSDDSSIDE